MGSRGNSDGYSRLIRIARITLILSAIILTASIFVFSKSNPLQTTQAFSEIELMRLAAGQEMTNPQFSGVTDSGHAYSISAETANLDAPKPNTVDLKEAAIELDFRDGRSLRSSAKDATINVKEQSIVLEGGVKIEASGGFLAETEKVLVDFVTGKTISPQRITATSPIGTIEAGSFTAFRRNDPVTNTEKSVLLFKNRVRVLYLPKRGKGTE